MDLRFPLTDVEIEITSKRWFVDTPIYQGNGMQVSQRTFAMDVEGIAHFYASDGNAIKIFPYKGADPEWIRLYQNGLVLVALLHQRKLMNFHAGCFVHEGKGVMVLGETGAGKSSLTLSFILNGAGFISDDLAPVVFQDESPAVWPLFSHVRLKEDTIVQMNIDPDRLIKAEQGTGKFYFPMDTVTKDPFPLHTVFKLEIHPDIRNIEFHELTGEEKFGVLRSEICFWEILKGMPETEEAYLGQLTQMISVVRMVKVIRPEKMAIAELYATISKFLRAEDHDII